MKTESLKPAGTLDMPRQEGLRLQAILGYTKTPSQKGKKKPSTKSLCRAQADERDIPYAPSQQDWLFFHEVGNMLWFGFGLRQGLTV